MDNAELLSRETSCAETVAAVLERDPRARNDDMWLLFQVWLDQGADMFVPYDDFGFMFSAESITRCRRKFQNDEHRFLPTNPTVLLKRGFKEEFMRSYYGVGDVHP